MTIDDFVKKPSASLRYILHHCGVPKSTPHSSGFARLASGAFYKVIHRPSPFGIRVFLLKEHL
jgi:hypothetical protein